MKSFSSAALGVGAFASVVLAGLTGAQAQNVAALQAEYRQVVGQIQQCNAAVSADLERLKRLAMQGRPEYPRQFACQAYMQGWVTRQWQLEIAFARVNGDQRQACQIQYMPGCENYRQ